MKIISIISSLFSGPTPHGMNSSKIGQNNIFNDNFIIKLIIFIIGFITFSPLLKVGLVTNDDLQFSLRAREIGFFNFMSDVYSILKYTGRAKFFSPILLYIPYASDNFIYYKIVSLAAIIISLIMVSYFMQILFNSKEVFYLSLLIGIIGIQNSWEFNPIVSLPFFFSAPIILFILSLVFYVFYLRGKKKYYQYLSIIFYLITLFSYEVYLLYLPLFFFIAYATNKPEKVVFKNIIKRTAPYIAISIIYLLVYLAFRAYHGSYYAGAQIDSNNFNVISIARTIWQFSIASIPTYFFWDNKYRWIFNALYNENLYTGSGLFSFFRIESLWFIKALFVFMLSIFILRYVRDDCFRKARSIGIGLIYIFLPTLLVAITQQYQDAVLKNDQRGNQLSYFSFLAFIYFFTLIIVFIKQKISNKILNKIYIVFIGLCLASVSLIVDNTNNYIAKYQIMSDLKWQTVNRFLKTEEYLNVPENAVIYAPSLWNIIGSVGIHDSYWSDYFRIISGKNVRVEKYSTQISNKDTNVYYLKYAQLLKDYDQNIIFGKADQLAGDDSIRFLSKKVVIYNLSKYNDYYIMGRLKEPLKKSCIEMNDAKKIAEDYIFQLNINEQNIVKEFDLKRTVLSSCSDNLIDDNSIFITPGVSNALEFSSNNKIDYTFAAPDAMNTLSRGKLLKGWFKRENTVTWISKHAVAMFKSGKIGKVIVKGFIPVDVFDKIYNNSLALSLFADGRMIKNINFTKTNIQDGYFEIEAEVSANRLVQFEIRLNKSFVPAEHNLGRDMRELSIAIKDIYLR
jgi:hypothetical protein